MHDPDEKAIGCLAILFLTLGSILVFASPFIVFLILYIYHAKN